MKVRVKLISGERCDHCNEYGTENLPLICFKYHGAYGNEQLWLHEVCLDSLRAKAIKLINKSKPE